MSYRLRLSLLSTALLLAGIVWAIQGYGERSIVNGRPEWLWIGIACALVGGGLLIAVNWPSTDRKR